MTVAAKTCKFATDRAEPAPLERSTGSGTQIIVRFHLLEVYRAFQTFAIARDKSVRSFIWGRESAHDLAKVFPGRPALPGIH